MLYDISVRISVNVLGVRCICYYRVPCLRTCSLYLDVTILFRDISSRIVYWCVVCGRPFRRAVDCFKIGGPRQRTEQYFQTYWLVANCNEPKPF